MNNRIANNSMTHHRNPQLVYKVQRFRTPGLVAITRLFGDRFINELDVIFKNSYCFVRFDHLILYNRIVRLLGRKRCNLLVKLNCSENPSTRSLVHLKFYTCYIKLTINFGQAVGSCITTRQCYRVVREKSC